MAIDKTDLLCWYEFDRVGNYAENDAHALGPVLNATNLNVIGVAGLAPDGRAAVADTTNRAGHQATTDRARFDCIDRTVCVWFNQQTPNEGATRFGMQCGDTSIGGWDWLTDQSSPNFRFRFRLYNAAGGQIHDLRTSFYPEDTWHFFAFGYDSGANQGFLSEDGGAFSTLTPSGTPALAGAGNVGMRCLGTGSNGAQNLAQAQICIYDRVLSLADVQTLYNSGVGIRYSDLGPGLPAGYRHTKLGAHGVSMRARTIPAKTGPIVSAGPVLALPGMIHGGGVF